MEPIFSEEKLQNRSKENIIALMQAMQEHQKKQKIKIQLLEEKMQELEFMNALLTDKLTFVQRKQFGSSSEKYADGYTQINLFNEAEQEADPNAAEPEMKEIHPQPYKRKKSTGKKEEDLSSFETTETIGHKLEGEDRFCPDCDTKYKAVATEKVKYLKFVPARFEAVEEITYVYSCPKCGSMKRPQKKPVLLKGSIATPSLVAGIMNAKYVNGMPLARQEQEFARYDLNLSAKTMANWIILCAQRYLQPVYGLMKEEFLRSRYIHCDENWMWVYLPECITVTGCMTHARRRFDEALTPLKKDFTKEQLKETTAYQAMGRIGMLYKIENLIRNKPPEEKYIERQKQSKPLLDAFFEWIIRWRAP